MDTGKRGLYFPAIPCCSYLTQNIMNMELRHNYNIDFKPLKSRFKKRKLKGTIYVMWYFYFKRRRKNLRTIIFNSESSNCVLISWFLNIIPEFLIHAFLIHISRVNSEGHGTKGRNSTVKSKQHSWAGQYKKCVQYNLKLSSLI